jgi:DNA-binding transcriptional LysR family regulator
VVYTQDRAGTDCWTFRRNDSQVIVSLPSRLHVSACEGVRAAVLSDIGFAITSRWIFATELARQTVRAVLLDWGLPATDLWAVFPTGRMASARARAFATFVETELRKHQIELIGEQQLSAGLVVPPFACASPAIVANA